MRMLLNLLINQKAKRQFMKFKIVLSVIMHHDVLKQHVFYRILHKIIYYKKNVIFYLFFFYYNFSFVQKIHNL